MPIFFMKIPLQEIFVGNFIDATMKKCLENLITIATVIYERKSLCHRRLFHSLFFPHQAFLAFFPSPNSSSRLINFWYRKYRQLFSSSHNFLILLLLAENFFPPLLLQDKTLYFVSYIYAGTCMYWSNIMIHRKNLITVKPLWSIDLWITLPLFFDWTKETRQIISIRTQYSNLTYQLGWEW